MRKAIFITMFKISGLSGRIKISAAGSETLILLINERMKPKVVSRNFMFTKMLKTIGNLIYGVFVIFEIYGKFNDISIWIVRKNTQCSKMFKYVYIRSTEELLKHIPLAVNSL